MLTVEAFMLKLLDMFCADLAESGVGIKRLEVVASVESHGRSCGTRTLHKPLGSNNTDFRRACTFSCLRLVFCSTTGY